MDPTFQVNPDTDPDWGGGVALLNRIRKKTCKTFSHRKFPWQIFEGVAYRIPIRGPFENDYEKT
jgi:hypothetical protein